MKVSSSSIVKKLRKKKNPKVKGKSKARGFFNESKRLRGKAKHAVLKTYLDGWFAIWLRFGKVPVYVDGFAGAGKHKVGKTQELELGSPVLIYKALADHNNLPDHQCAVQLIFFEEQKELYEELCQNLEQAKRDNPIKSPHLVIHTKVLLGDFNKLIDDVLLDYRERPMFVFVDPFGYKCVKMKTLQKIIQSHGCFSPRELLINFMDFQLLRFPDIQNKKRQKTQNEFLGKARDSSENWREAIRGKKPQEKLNYLCEYYGRRLQEGHEDKQYGQFRPSMHFADDKNLLLKFSMRNNNNCHIYHLIFVTCNKHGFKNMKSTMSRKSHPKAEAEGFYFSEWDAANGKEQGFNFGQKNEIAQNLVHRLHAEFSGQGNISGEKVENFVWFDTPYACTVKNELKLALKVSGNVSRQNGSNKKFEKMTFVFSSDKGLLILCEGTTEIVEDLVQRLKQNFEGEENVLGCELAQFIKYCTPYRFNIKALLKEAMERAGLVSPLNCEKAFEKMIFGFSKNDENVVVVETTETESNLENFSQACVMDDLEPT